MTNIQGTVWTNNAGTRLEVTNAGNTVRFFKDATLWSDRDGRVPITFFSVAPNVAHSTNASVVNAATMYLQIQGASGANSAVTFVFTPLWDGDSPPLVTVDDWSVAVTAVASAQTSLATNVPLWRWPGAKKLRLKSIVNSDTDASSGVYVNKVSLNGFVP
jgi:hypothetical protein